MPLQLSPEWLECEKVLGARPVLEGDIQSVKTGFVAMGEQLAAQLPPPDPEVATRDETIEGVPVRIYNSKSQSGKLPVGIFAHSGGWCCGDLDQEDILCRLVSKATPCVLISVDYPLGPDHKQPAMFDAVLKVYKWAWHNTDDFQGDQSKFFTIGGSAGGALALGIAQYIVGKPEVRSHIQGCVSMVPVVVHPHNVPAKYKSGYTALEENASAPMLTKSMMYTFLDAAGVDPQSAEQFPLLSPNLQHMPPTYIAAAGADPLYSDAVLMNQALQEAGVKTKFDEYPGFPHYFWAFPGLAEGQKFIGNLLAGVSWVLSQ